MTKDLELPKIALETPHTKVPASGLEERPLADLVFNSPSWTYRRLQFPAPFAVSQGHVSSSSQLNVSRCAIAGQCI